MKIENSDAKRKPHWQKILNCAFITSYERDSESELDFAQARYYSSKIARFYSIDPENYGASEDDPQSWNGYAYSRNNPILYSDPDGLEYKICDAKGENCVTHSDESVLKGQKERRDLFEETGRKGKYKDSGNILNEDGSLLGTYERTSIDPDYQFVYGIADESEKKTKTALIVGSVAVVVGTGIGAGLGTVGFVGARFLANRLAISILRPGALARMISDGQTKLIRELLGSAKAGALRALANPKISNALTNESLIVYREIAKRALDKDGTQLIRIQIIEKVLLQRGIILP